MATTNNQTSDGSQTTFLGATVIDFNSNLAFRSQGSSLQVNIVEDKSNVRSTNDTSYGNYNFTTDGQGRVASVANDPNIPSSYPNGDEFYFPALGNAVFFQFEEFKFNGILKSVERNISPAGGVTFTTSVDDPSSVLDGIQVILGDYIGMGEPNYGWLTATYNTLNRGPSTFEGGALNNPTFNFGSSPFLSLGMWNPGGFSQIFYNVINPYGYIEQFFGLGSTRENWDGTIAGMDQTGMNWLTCLETVTTVINEKIWGPHHQFGGPIKFAGSRFRIDMIDLWDLYVDGILPVNYRFGTNNSTLLQLISDVCQTASCDFYLTIDRIGKEQDYDPNSSTNEWLNRIGPALGNGVGDINDTDPTDGAPISGVIRVNVVRRTAPPTSLTVIQNMIEELVGAGDVLKGQRNLDKPDQPQETAGVPFEADDAVTDPTTGEELKRLVSATHGRELSDDAIGKVLIGGKQSRIATGNSVFQVWATATNPAGAQLVGTQANLINDTTQVMAQVPGVGSYPCTIREMRHAMVSKDAWEAFICACRSGIPNSFNPGGMNVAGAYNIGSSFSRITPAILTKLQNGELTPFLYNALTSIETNISNQVHAAQLNEQTDKIYNAVRTLANDFYGKQLAVPLPLMVKGYGEVGQRVNEWEITSTGWVEPGYINGQYDANLVDEKGRVRGFVTYSTFNDFSEFGDDDFVYPNAGSATLVNLNIDSKVFDAGIYNYALVKVGSAPKRFDMNYNGLWQSMDLAYGTSLQSQAFTTSFGGDNGKYTIAPSKAYPFEYGVPQESRYHVYGPWASQSAAIGTGYGKIDLEVDSELKPENIASTAILDSIALARVFANTVDGQQAERGSITLTGGPTSGTNPQIDSVNLGTQMINGGPYLTGLSVNVAADQIQTTYQMATWKVAFGKLAMFNQKKIEEVVTNRNKASKIFRQLFKVPPPNKFYANMQNKLTPPKRFQSSTTHPYVGMHAYKYGDFVYPFVGSLGNDEIRVYSKNHQTNQAYVDWSAVVRGFGASGPIGNFPGHHNGTGFTMGDDMWPTAQFLNHWNFQGDEGDHDTGVVKSSNSDPTIERAGFGSSQKPMGLRGPLYLVGWGFDLCADPVPGAGGAFVPNHRRKSDSWKAGPVDLRWNSKTETWQPPPQILQGTSTQNVCDGDFEAELSDCNSRLVTVKNPLDIPVRQGASVLIWSDQEENDYVLIQSEYYKEDDYVVCDVSCCDDGTLAVSLKDFFVQWPADPECVECPEADCGNGSGVP